MSATYSTLEGRDKSTPTKIAIIGSGLAGLHAAHLLCETEQLRQRFDVHIFEKGDKLGLDGSSVTVDGVRIDVPLRSFNAGYYPNLMNLYKKLNIPIRKNNFTFSFSTSSDPRSPSLLYNGHSGLRGFSVSRNASSNFISSINLFGHLNTMISFVASYLVLIGIALYHHLCDNLNNPRHTLSKQSFQSWLDQHSRYFSSTFVDSILLSLFSAMTTSSHWRVQLIPASEILLYVATTFLRDHYTIDGGVYKAQEQLICNVTDKNIHTGMTIQKVVASTSTSSLNLGTCDVLAVDRSTGERLLFRDFHHIIFATPANLSASLLGSYRESLSSYQERDTLDTRIDQIAGMQAELEEVCYETSTVINHTDDLLLPKKRSDWRDLNLVSSLALGIGNGSAGEVKSLKGQISHTMATHVCHQRSDGQSIFQTTNPIIMPRHDTILSTSTFSRALTQSKSKQYRLFAWTRRGFFRRWQLQLGTLQLHNSEQTYQDFPKMWFCGSYSQGIPLLEGCVTSSSLVVEQIIHQSIC